MLIHARIYHGTDLSRPAGGSSVARARAGTDSPLTNAGAGNLVGYLGTGAVFAACINEGHVRWPVFLEAACH